MTVEWITKYEITLFPSFSLTPRTGMGLPKTGTFFYKVLSSQNVSSGSGRAGRLRLMGKYVDHRLVARPELDNIFGQIVHFIIIYMHCLNHTEIFKSGEFPLMWTTVV